MKKRFLAFLIIFLMFSFKSYALEVGKYQAAVLIEVNSGKILYEYNKDKPLPPASITKLMTYFTFREFMESQKIDSSEKISINLGNGVFDKSWAGVGLRRGDRISLRNLIDTMMVYSANDSALQLEAYYNTKKPRGYDFIEAMNIKAKELGLKNTKYFNSTGLTETEVFNMSSAFDTALLASELMKKYPDITKITSQKEIEFQGKRYKNWNLLLFSDKKIDGLKTGHTDKAGYCLVSTKDITNNNGNGMPFRLLAVVFGSPADADRFAESRKLLDFGQANFENRIAADEGTLYKLENEYYKGGYIEAGIEKNIYMLANKKDTIEKKVEFYEKLPRRIKKGDEVGVIRINNLSTKETINEKLYASRDYEPVSILKRIILFLKKIFS